MIKVIFFDIDGTLVPTGKLHILDSTAKAFKALRSKGIHIVICTRRHVTEISEGNDLSNYDFDGIIATTGQYCLDASKKPFYTKAMNEYQHTENISLFEDLLFVHAQDTLMTINSEVRMAQQFIDVYKILENLEVKNDEGDGRTV